MDDDTEMSVPSTADMSGGGDLDDTTAPGTKKPSARYLRNMHDFLAAGEGMVDEEGADQENEDVLSHMENMKSMLKDGKTMCSDLHQQMHGSALGEGEENKSGTGGSHEPEGQTTDEVGHDQIDGIVRKSAAAPAVAAKPVKQVATTTKTAAHAPRQAVTVTRKSAAQPERRDYAYEAKLRTLQREEEDANRLMEELANE